MKLQFTIAISGDDTLKTKFETSINENPKIHMDLIKSFGQAIMLALKLDDKDNIIIENFRANEIA